MANYLLLVPKIKQWEGGYSNHPMDTGGPTMKGVTLATYRRFYGASKTSEDLKKITDQQWASIFKVGYWDKLRADSIVNQSIADICVDWAWMSGSVTAAKGIQKALGLVADGLVGPKTLAALNAADKAAVFSKIFQARYKFFRNIVDRNPSQKIFLKGWLNRLNAYKFKA